MSSCKNNNSHGPILQLNCLISLNLFLSVRIYLALLLIKVRLLFDSIRSSSAQITIKLRNTNGNKSIFATILKTKSL